MTIKIYSTPACVFCKKAKELFQNNNVEYTEVDVANNPEGREELLNKTQRLSVPVIDVDGKIYTGYNEMGLKRAVGIA
jgi:glutaredoxin 3